MRKFILHILFFFIIAGFIDMGVGSLGRYLQGHAKGGSTRQFDNLVMKDQHDILILGSSRAHHHYDTPFLSETLGLDVYNAGYDGNGVVLAKGILEMVLNRYTPKIVLFDVEPSFDINVYALDNNHIRYINNLKPYYKEKGVSDIIKDVSMEEWYKAKSGMIRFNTEILGMLVDNILDRGLKRSGFAPLNGKIEYEPETRVSKPSKLDPFKLEYIEKLIDLCQSHNVPLAFVGSPKYGVKNSLDIQPVKEIAEKHGVLFLDYYAAPLFQTHKEWFSEPTHLNAEGARRFSKIIANDINNLLIN